MDFKVQLEGHDKASQHPHFVPWDELYKVENPTEAMNQDRFQAALILRAFAKGNLSQEELPTLIHNSCMLWIKLAGDAPQPYHVPYHEAGQRSIDEREKQAECVWPILQQIDAIDEIQQLDWIP